MWKSRHRALLAVLLLHALGLPLFGAVQGYGLEHNLGHGAGPAALAVLALLAGERRRLAAALVSVGLISSSALLVHTWGGVIEGHFHFFVMIILLSLYEDWVPFLLAAAYVVLHHGVTGALDPGAVYNHRDAVAHPWKWAAIHGLFVTAAGVACVAAWRLNEGVRAGAKEAYRRARESEDRFKSAFEEAPIGMVLVGMGADGLGRLIQVNRAMSEITGHAGEKLIGSDFWSFTHPDDAEKGNRVLARLLAGEVSSVQVELRYLHADGQVVWGRASFSLVRENSGEPLYAIAQIEDVTERRRAATELREHKDRLQALLDNAPAVIYAKDAEGRYLFINRRYESVFGVKAEEIVGTTDYDVFPADVADEFRANDREVLERDGAVEIEETAPHEDGLHTYLSIKFPLRDEAGTAYAVCGISTDVTERRQIEAQLARKDEIEAANRARSDFLSRVSHELRTPLNAILGFAQLLELDELEDEQRDNVAHIVRGGRHLLELINEILDISRIEAGTMTVSLEPIHVASVLGGVVDLVRPLAAEHRVSILTDFDPRDDRYVFADHQRLRQVLLNLLSNAVKYNRTGGTATVSMEGDEEERLRILVADTGQGISDEQLDKLFSPFERLGAEQSAVEGTGLGLTLSQLLVEAMGGILGVSSQVGAGTTFIVELELADAPTLAASGPDAPDEVGPDGEAPAQKHTVIHIEDNLSNLMLVERALADRHQIDLLGSTDGEHGLHLVQEQHPDLVLLDIHLPSMSGVEVLDRLQSDPSTRDIPVVVISADATQGQVKRLLQGGARAYLTKPLDIKCFLATVEETLNGESGS